MDSSLASERSALSEYHLCPYSWLFIALLTVLSVPVAFQGALYSHLKNQVKQKYMLLKNTNNLTLKLLLGVEQF